MAARRFKGMGQRVWASYLPNNMQTYNAAELPFLWAHHQISSWHSPSLLVWKHISTYICISKPNAFCRRPKHLRAASFQTTPCRFFWDQFSTGVAYVLGKRFCFPRPLVGIAQNQQDSTSIPNQTVTIYAIGSISTTEGWTLWLSDLLNHRIFFSPLCSHNDLIVELWFKWYELRKIEPLPSSPHHSWVSDAWYAAPCLQDEPPFSKGPN